LGEMTGEKPRHLTVAERKALADALVEGMAEKIQRSLAELIISVDDNVKATYDAEINLPLALRWFKKLTIQQLAEQSVTVSGSIETKPSDA